MKNFKTIALLFVLFATSFSCCKDDDNNPPGENESFSEYFTCKINGVEFNPRGSFYCNNKNFTYYQESIGDVPAGYLLISGRDCPSNKSVAIRINGMTTNTGYLDFIEPVFADSCFPAYFQIIIGSDPILFERLIMGSMNITTFTPRDSITQKLGKIEGTFEFTVSNEELDSTIHVTDGAFRFKVPNIW